MAERPYRDPPAPPPPPRFASERRHLLVVIALTIVTLGIYELVWYWRRRTFFDALGVRATIPLPIIAGTTLLFVAALVFQAQGAEGSSAVCSLGDIVLRYVLAYQARAALNQWAKREKMPGAPSGLWTFVWRFLYLQRRMTRVAEREVEIAKLRRAKRAAEIG